MDDNKQSKKSLKKAPNKPDTSQWSNAPKEADFHGLYEKNSSGSTDNIFRILDNIQSENIQITKQIEINISHVDYIKKSIESVYTKIIAKCREEGARTYTSLSKPNIEITAKKIVVKSKLKLRRYA